MSKSCTVKLDTIVNNFNRVLSEYCVLSCAIVNADCELSDSIQYYEFSEACAVMFAELKDKLCSVFDELKALNSELNENEIKEIQKLIDNN